MLPDRATAISLDGEWAFVPDPARRLTADRLPAGVPVAVPGAWEADLREPQGIVHGWYRRGFTVPGETSEGSLVLRFAATSRSSRVWLDGRAVGAMEDGSLPFELDAGVARADSGGADHELVVEVENPFNALTDFPAFDRDAWRRLPGIGDADLERLPAGKQTWYASASGLLGSVSVAVVPEVRLDRLAVRPNAEAGAVVVKWSLAGDGGAPPARIELAVRSPAGEVVAERTVDAGDGVATLEVPSIERWDLWHPALYRLHASLVDAPGGASDRASLRFGFRTVGTSGGAITLNGRRIYVRGALDQDLWPLARSPAPARQALDHQIALAREMGCNLLRCHIKIPDAAYLDAADEAGMLLWCELPSWGRIDEAEASRARDLLAGMVEAFGHHPSIVAWTIVNEDWGTDLRHSARDRRWLRDTADWLKTADPSRLVIDNSACETADGPNFHLRSDLADFHAYRTWPDHAGRWRELVTDLASRPAWLWSPFGDAAPTGEEPLLMSEFGGWGLPRPSSVLAADGTEPWWWSTGQASQRPAGIESRFRAQRLDRIWPSLDALAEATQWQQYEGFASQVRELRRHGTIAGYVVTELSDATWEPNGLLDIGRGRKVFHDRLCEVNAEDVLILDLPRADLWAGETFACEVLVASAEDGPAGRAVGSGAAADQEADVGRIDWSLRLDGGRVVGGSAVGTVPPGWGPWVAGRLEIAVPDVDDSTGAELRVTASWSRDQAADRQATLRRRVVIVPEADRRTRRPLPVAVADPERTGDLQARLTDLGHRLVPSMDAALIVSATVDVALADLVRGGPHLLVLARSPDAVGPGVALEPQLAVAARRPADAAMVDRPWDGDWTSVFTWALPGIVPGLPAGGLLAEPHAEVNPDHVITGLDVADPSAGVAAGIFAGWIHRPAAVLATFALGGGRITITTLRLAPEDGPVATALLESIIQAAAREESVR